MLLNYGVEEDSSLMEKTLESPLDCNKVKPINPKGNQS